MFDFGAQVAHYRRRSLPGLHRNRDQNTQNSAIVLLTVLVGYQFTTQYIPRISWLFNPLSDADITIFAFYIYP